MRLLLTRPLEDSRALAMTLGKAGISSLIEPLLSIEYHDGPDIEMKDVQALLVTSANGVRAFARRSMARSVKVLAVGDASARAAVEVGFKDVKSASGDVHSLTAMVVGNLQPDRGVLIHAAGSKVAGDLAGMLGKAGFTYRREVLYESRRAESLSPGALKAIQTNFIDGVVFFSPRTAATFVSLASREGVADNCQGLTAFCLSPAVADKVGSLSWNKISVAERCDQEALLVAVGEASRSAAINART